jgi:hypothetical protein
MGYTPGMAVETTQRPDTADEVDLHTLDAWWRAANYLSVGQRSSPRTWCFAVCGDPSVVVGR